MVEALIIGFMVLVAALTQRPPDNALVLLAEEDGTVGQVVLTRGADSVTLSGAETGVVLDRGIAQGRVRAFSQDEIQGLFGEALAIAPQGARSYLLYFDLSRSGIQAESEAAINAILADIVAREVPRVAVIGHTDRSGPAAVNVELGLERATFVRDVLVAGGVPADIIDLRSHGEGDPLIPTADGVANAENRRVEVMVR